MRTSAKFSLQAEETTMRKLFYINNETLETFKNTPLSFHLSHVSRSFPLSYSFCTQEPTPALLLLSHCPQALPPRPPAVPPGLQEPEPWESRGRMLQKLWAAASISQLSAAKSQGKEWHFQIVTFCTSESESKEDKEMSGDWYGPPLPIIEQESCMSQSMRSTQLVNHHRD